jgi:hypothetical protein
LYVIVIFQDKGRFALLRTGEKPRPLFYNIILTNPAFSFEIVKYLSCIMINAETCKNFSILNIIKRETYPANISLSAVVSGAA